MIGQFIFLDGVFMEGSTACISPFDRGFLFADSVYEMIGVYGGKMLHAPEHLGRLRRSLEMLSFPPVADNVSLEQVLEELISRNALVSGRVYLQISRGNANRRDFHTPDWIIPTVFAYAEQAELLEAPALREGISIITLPEQRWARRDIKSNGLLAQCMAYSRAAGEGCADAFMVEDGQVTEAISANAWIVRSDGVLQTRQLSSHILSGVTREMILEHSLPAARIEEKAFTPEQAQQAAEVFISSATRLIVPVISIDGYKIGDAVPGRQTRWLQRLYFQAAGMEVPEWLEADS